MVRVADLSTLEHIVSNIYDKDYIYYHNGFSLIYFMLGPLIRKFGNN